MNDSRLEQLIEAYFDDALDAAGLAELSACLETDSSAREIFWEKSRLHGALRTWGQEQAGVRQLEAAGLSGSEPARGSGWSFLRIATIAASLALIAVVWFGINRFRQDTLTVANAEGDVSWTDGVTTRKLTTGQWIGAGTIKAATDHSFAKFRFTDGSILTLEGGSEAEITTDAGKLVQLKSGSIGADVQPQSVDEPMIIRTETAEMRVLGTAFTVDSRPTATRLQVNHGRVAMRRAADGAEVEVGSQQFAVASTNYSLAMNAHIIASASFYWKAPLGFSQQDDLSLVTGRWFGSGGGWPDRVRAVPAFMGFRPNGQPTVRLAVQVGTPENSPSDGLVRLSRDSVLTLAWRMQRPGRATLSFTTSKGFEDFGGSFELNIPGKAGVVDAAGWRRGKFALKTARPLTSGATLDNRVLRRMTFSCGIGLEFLELAEVIIETPPKQ